MKLRTLLRLQAAYAAMALVYLAVSYVRTRTGEIPLSAGAPLPMAVLVAVYAICLSFGMYREHLPYRVAMAIAIPALALGGVLMNVLDYLDSGLEGFSSFPAWAIAVGINAYGLIWNVIAAIGAYDRNS